MLLGLVVLVFASFASAFDITFPGPSNYWVACGWNNMTWKSASTDTRIVTIMLTNTNKTLLNDDFEIGNALQGDSNAAMVYLPCLPPSSGYSLMFVNASSYDHTRKSTPFTVSNLRKIGFRRCIDSGCFCENVAEDKVLYSSHEFSIKAKGSAPDKVSGQESIPSQIQPYLQTPGIVLPPTKSDDVTNTTSTGNGEEEALPRLDGSSASFGTFQPKTHSNAAASMDGLNDLLFVVVIAAFTTLVVMT